MKISNKAKHIVLIGFKAAGKSVLGRELAKQLHLNFIDLDEKIEQGFLQKQGQKLTCRQIMLKFGQDAFRELEHETLKQALLEDRASVIASGGGMPMFEANYNLIKGHKVIQVTAPKNIVFERIMINGRPAFFPPGEPPLRSFYKIWEQRQPVYDQLSQLTVNNDGSLQKAVDELMQIINYKNP